MSVSVLDQSVANHRPPPPKDEKQRNAPANAPVSEQKAGRINFNASDQNTAKLFGSQGAGSQSRAEGRASSGLSGQSVANDAQSQGLLGQFTLKVKGWCGGNPPQKPKPCNNNRPPCNTPPKPCKPKPPEPDPCNIRPPERPRPCKKPDPYPCKSNESLLQMLNNAFDRFRTPDSGSYINTKTIRAFAQKDPARHPSQRDLINLARALDSREGLLGAIDRHSTTGALDKLVDRQKIQMTINDPSPLKYQSDKQLVGEMLNNFPALRDPDYPDYIHIDKLKDVAKWPTGDNGHGRLAWIAQEVLKRSQVKDQMDGGDNWWGTDGWIKKSTLEMMFK